MLSIEQAEDEMSITSFYDALTPKRSILEVYFALFHAESSHTLIAPFRHSLDLSSECVFKAPRHSEEMNYAPLTP